MGGASDDAADGRRLRRCSALAGLGDGALAVALLLLAAGVSTGPLAVAAVVAGYHLPWAVLALTGTGSLAAADQRTVLGLGSSLRAGAVVVVGLLGLAGLATPVSLVVVALVAGSGAALADAAEEEITRTGVLEAGGGSGDLRRPAMAAMAVIGLPLGGLAYEVAAALPFLVDVGVFALAGLSVLAVRRPLPAGGRQPEDRRALPPLVRGSGAVTAVAAAVTLATSAVLGVLAVLATDDLGLGAPAFGLLLAGLALASVCGALAAPTAGAVLGLRGGTGAALALAGAGYAGAGVLADPTRPLVGAVALGVGAGAAMVASVLLRALLHTGGAPGAAGVGLAAFHARVWPAVPAGALAGGLGAEVVGVGRLVAAAGLVVAAAALGAWRLPAPRQPLAPLALEKIG